MTDDTRDRETLPPEAAAPSAELSPTEAIKLLTDRMDAFMEASEAREARIETSLNRLFDNTILEREEWRKSQKVADEAMALAKKNEHDVGDLRRQVENLERRFNAHENHKSHF